MSSNDTDHSGIWSVNRHLCVDASNTESADTATISAEIIRWLPLLAANDFLDEDVLPPVA